MELAHALVADEGLDPVALGRPRESLIEVRHLRLGKELEPQGIDAGAVCEQAARLAAEFGDLPRLRRGGVKDALLTGEDPKTREVCEGCEEQEQGCGAG